jgi:lipid A 3-O-deacylase
MLIAVTVLAQENSRNGGYSREVEGVADNDYFFYEDYYYTAGIDFFYRRLLRPESGLYNRLAGHKKDTAKVILHFRYGLKIFNPFNIETNEVKDMDRPYAGWNFASTGISVFRQPRRGNRIEVETGVVGPASGMESLQLWVHKITTYDPPEGWENQIRNEWIVNVSYSHVENWKLADDADLVSQSSVQAGTGSNKLSQDVTLRLIQFNPVNNSAFTQSRLSWEKPSRNERNELFIFAGGGVDYVISSVFIEGSLFRHHQSAFTVPAEPWVFRRSVGIMYSNHKVSCSATVYHLTKEVAQGRVHDIASLRLALRF